MVAQGNIDKPVLSRRRNTPAADLVVTVGQRSVVEVDVMTHKWTDEAGGSTAGGCAIL